MPDINLITVLAGCHQPAAWGVLWGKVTVRETSLKYHVFY